MQEKIDKWKVRLPNKFESVEHWSSNSWTFVGSAHKTINKDIAKTYIENSADYKKGVDMYDYYKKYQDYKVSECTDHRQFLEGLK